MLTQKGRERGPAGTMTSARPGTGRPLLVAALTRQVGKKRAEEMAAAFLAANPDGTDDGQGKRFAVEAAAAWCAGWLASQDTDLAGTCQQYMPGILADGWLIGGASAAALADGQAPDWGGWSPGDTDSARDRAEALGLGAGLGAALGHADAAAEEMAGGFVTQMARALVDGVTEGLGPAALGAAVFKALSDEGYANGSVLAQLVVAAGAAAMAVYLGRKVQRVRWAADPSSNVCPTAWPTRRAAPTRLPMRRAVQLTRIAGAASFRRDER